MGCVNSRSLTQTSVSQGMDSFYRLPCNASKAVQGNSNPAVCFITVHIISRRKYCFWKTCAGFRLFPPREGHHAFGILERLVDDMCRATGELKCAHTRKTTHCDAERTLIFSRCFDSSADTTQQHAPGSFREYLSLTGAHCAQSAPF